jgi:hypothetical protein
MTATATMANRAIDRGSGVFCGRMPESGLAPDVLGEVAGTTAGPTWTGGNVEDSPSGAGATERTLGAVAGETPLDPPRAALSWLLVEAEGPRALVAEGVGWGLATMGIRPAAPD